jgi:hypothetical protein
MEKILGPLMPSTRTFSNEPPKGWIGKDRLLAEIGISDRRLAEWAPHLGLRTCLVSRGRNGIEAYYPPDSVGMIKRLLELRAQSPRDMDRSLWQLWLEGEDVDITAWAKKHLARGLRELGRRRSSGYSLMLKRVRRPTHRVALVSYAHLAATDRAGPGRETSLLNADPPIWDLALKIAGLPSNARPPSGEQKNIEHSYSFSHLYRLLSSATGDEIQQARRDWQMLARWVEAAGTIDWNSVGPDLELKIRTLEGARPDPPSWRARKAQRQRQSPPDLVQSLVAFWPELAARAAVLPLLIGFRRSPILDQIITRAAATTDWEFDRLPRRPSPTTPGNSL